MAESKLTPESKFGAWKTARERRMRIAVTSYWMARWRTAAEMFTVNPTPAETLQAMSHTAMADNLAEELVYLLGEPLPDVLQK